MPSGEHMLGLHTKANKEISNCGGKAVHRFPVQIYIPGSALRLRRPSGFFGRPPVSNSGVEKIGLSHWLFVIRIASYARIAAYVASALFTVSSEAHEQKDPPLLAGLRVRK